MKKETGKIRKNTFYKTNPSGGISLIVLVITIIVVIILAAAVIISLQNNNPMVEANKARINSDVANMQAIFTNTVGKIMAENQDVVQVEDRQLNSVTSGQKKTTGETIYKILGEDGHVVVEGSIIFAIGKNKGTTYYTGKELPIYSSETKWSVDKQGMISVEVGGIPYGEGSKSENPPVEEEGDEIIASDNPMLQSWDYNSTTDFHKYGYRNKITKVKFATNVKVPKSATSWDVSKDKDKSVIAWLKSDGNEGYILTIAGKDKIIANPNSSYLFNNFPKLVEIENIGILDTSNVTNMARMFDDCIMLKSLDLSEFDTSNVTNMISMFETCSKLTNLNLSGFDTSNVTDMGGMFSGCSSLSELNLSSFDTSNVTDMGGMFSGCRSLTSLDLSNFNTSKVTAMWVMFGNCEKLKSIELSNFNTSNVESMNDMFLRCTSLENLNLSNFDTSKVSYMTNMFNGCNKLSTTINVMKWVRNYDNVFLNAATEPNAKIIVNYTEESSGRIDSIIATKSANSNVVKGVQI